jgi:hypothetical protein
MPFSPVRDIGRTVPSVLCEWIAKMIDANIYQLLEVENIYQQKTVTTFRECFGLGLGYSNE